MRDWRKILHEIYTPEVGSLWAAPNRIWTTSFASGKPENDYHPSVIGRISGCKTSCNIVPGTTKGYGKGACVYKVKLNPSNPDSVLSYFLINLWMTLSKSDLMKLRQGWNGLENLNNEQLNDFKLQIKFCKGIDV